MKSEKEKITLYSKEGILQAGLVFAAFLATWAFGYMVSPVGGGLSYTNSILSVFLFLFFCFLFGKIRKQGFGRGKRKWIWPGICGSLFAVSMCFGIQLDQKGNVPFINLKMWGAVLILAVCCSLLLRYVWDLGDGLIQKRHSGKGALLKAEASGEKRGRSILFYGGVIFLLYMPVYLAVYPGFFVYDAQEELMEVVTRSFTTHHPLVHVLLLGGVIQLVHKLTGSYNLGIACYTLLQMAVMAGIFGYGVSVLKSRGVKRWGRVLLTCYFGLCPVLVMFSLCSAKDGLFTGMLLLMVLLLEKLVREPESFFGQKGNVLLLFLSCTGMMLLRHNGFYAFLVSIPALLWGIQRNRRKAAVFFLGTVIAYMLISSGLSALLHADTSENQEMLTVPISQLARVYADQKESLPKEECEILYRYLPEQALDRYTPKVTDGVKIAFCNEAYREDAGSFWRLWARWGIQNPFTYLNAWFMTSYGFWYPDTVIDVYRGNSVFTFTYGDSSYFGFEVEQPGKRESRIPILNELYRRISLEISFQKIPVLSQLFSPGTACWCFLFLLGFLLYLGRWRWALPYLPVFFSFLTVLLGPTYLVRYVVYFWAVLPFLGAEVIRSGEGSQI